MTRIDGQRPNVDFTFQRAEGVGVSTIANEPLESINDDAENESEAEPRRDDDQESAYIWSRNDYPDDSKPLWIVKSPT
jgi:hypothetical protein